MNVPEDKKNLTAAELYKKIAPSFGKEWYAIFTAPNEAGEMRVYVAKENNIIEYDLPIHKTALIGRIARFTLIDFANS